MFYGIDRRILAQEEGRLICLEYERPRPRLLLTSPVKRAHGRAVLAGPRPLVVNAKFEFRDGRTGLDGIDGGKEIVNIDPVGYPCKLLNGRHIGFLVFL